MKKSILLMTFVLTFGLNALAQTPKTVTDYFLAMPNDVYSTDINGKQIKGKTALTKHRKSLIKVEDKKNGYLRLEGNWEGWAEIALFKKKDGSYLIAQAESGCGPACEGFIKFFTYKAGKWTDVTTKVFPSLSEDQIINAFAARDIDTEEDGTSHYFLLPQIGTTIKMACNVCTILSDSDTETVEEDITLMEFSWNGEKFSIKK